MQLYLGDRLLLSDCEVAEGFFSRFLGLMGRRALGASQGLLIPRCKSVHTWFMRFAIDVIFLTDRGQGDWQVRKIVVARGPWSVLPVSDWGADSVLELGAGEGARLGLAPGAQIRIKSSKFQEF